MEFFLDRNRHYSQLIPWFAKVYFLIIASLIRGYRPTSIRLLLPYLIQCQRIFSNFKKNKNIMRKNVKMWKSSQIIIAFGGIFAYQKSDTSDKSLYLWHPDNAVRGAIVSHSEHAVHRVIIILHQKQSILGKIHCMDTESLSCIFTLGSRHKWLENRHYPLYATLVLQIVYHLTDFGLF